MYQIKGLMKFAEVDDFEQGCLLEGGYDAHVSATFREESIDALISKVCGYLCIDEKDDAVSRDACEEKGRIDFACTECEDGTIANDRELAEWKAGKRKLFYVVYSGYVERVEAVSAIAA